MTGLPAELTQALDEIADSLGTRSLAAHVDRLQVAYRTPGVDLSTAPALTPQEADAYAVYRVPATYAAVSAALDALLDADPDFAPRTLLDVGGGSGAAVWAVTEAFPDLVEARVLERDAAMTKVGERLAAGAGHDAVRGAIWIRADIARAPSVSAADLVTASYSLGELSESTVDAVVTALAAQATTIVVVEPGTPRGFATIDRVRSSLIAAGMTLAAPCPHASECPMIDGDWCHMAVRLNRSAAHRRAKRASLDYEDEKFSYVVGTRRPVVAAPARVLRQPQIRSGHVRLRLCTQGNGLQDVTVTKKHGSDYKAARGISWGDPWPPIPSL